MSYDFWFKTLRDSKARAAKDHDKKFRSKLAASFSDMIHFGSIAINKLFTESPVFTGNILPP